MKIVFVDDNNFILKLIKTFLSKLDIKNFVLFDDVSQFLKYMEKNEPDIIFVDFHMPKINGLQLLKKIKEKYPDTIVIMLTSIKNDEIKKEAIELGVTDFIYKDNLTFSEFKAKLKMMINLRKFLLQEKNKNKLLEAILKYKETKEKEAILKQNKIIKNDLGMFFDENLMTESFFKSLDVLNGDSILTKKIGKNEYIFTIIDAMDKGISAAITSLNSISFLDYSISKAIEYNDFNFERNLKDFINYTKSLLLENEALGVNILYIKGEEVYIANFGLPPIYTEKEKIKTNNLPLTIYSDDIKIDKIAMPQQIILYSDGIIESPLKEKINTPYFIRFREVKNKIIFLKDLIKDFKEYAQQTDDITAIFIRKDDFVFENKITIEKNLSSIKDIDEVLEKLSSLPFKENGKILFIFQELLMNTYEHNMIELSKDKEVLVKTNKLFDEKVKRDVDIKIEIFYNDELIKIIFFEENKQLDPKTLKDLFFKKYHGRGLKIIANLSDAVFMDETTQYLKIFLRRE